MTNATPQPTHVALVATARQTDRLRQIAQLRFPILAIALAAVRAAIGRLCFNQGCQRTELARWWFAVLYISGIDLSYTASAEASAVAIEDHMMSSLIPEITIFGGLEQSIDPKRVARHIDWPAYLIEHPCLS